MRRNDLCRIVSFAFLLLALTGCSSSDSSTKHDHSADQLNHKHDGAYPINTLCTTGQVAEMIRRVGGKHVAVTQLMGPGIDPHGYKPAASDNRALGKAEAVFFSGLHLEGRMTELFEQMARKKMTYAVTTGLVERKDKRLRKPPEFDGVYDPHVWHDVALWSECVDDLAEKLAEFDPSHAEDYRANAKAYRAELAEVDAFVKEETAKLPKQQRVLVTAHDAFEYFGAAYGFDVFGLKGISTEMEKDIPHQEEIQKMIIERHVPAVFVESAVNERTIQALVEPCRAAGHELAIGGMLYADALGKQGTDAESYAGMIRNNVTAIVSALSDTAALSQ